MVPGRKRSVHAAIKAARREAPPGERQTASRLSVQGVARRARLQIGRTARQSLSWIAHIDFRSLPDRRTIRGEPARPDGV